MPDPLAISVWGNTDPQTDPVLEQRGRLPATGGAALRAAFDEALDTTATSLLGREFDRQINRTIRENDARSAIPLNPDPYLDPETANERYGLEGDLSFDEPVPESRAAELNAIHRRVLARNDMLERGRGNLLPGSTLAAGLAGSLFDPAAAALAVMPGGAIARAIPGVRGLQASTALTPRLAAGFVDGAAAGLGAEFAIAPLMTMREQREYGVADVLMNVALSGGFGMVGAAFRARAGRAAPEDEAMSAPVQEASDEARASAFVSAVADAADDAPIESPARVLSADRDARMEALSDRDGETIRSAPIREDIAITPTGARVRVGYAIVEAGDLVTSHLDDMRANPRFPPELQPRDRQRADMELQIGDIARGLDPLRVGETFDASGGAPIISRRGEVESGNGRSMAIRRAYREGMDSAAAYRAALTERGYPVDDFERPVLVRVRLDAMDGEARAAFTRDANSRTIAALSAGEQARADAQALDLELFDAYQGGDAGLAKNRVFQRGFVDRVAGRNDRNALVDDKGELSGDGLRRMNDAILAYAFDNPDMITRLVEGPGTGLKGIAGALRDAAPEIAAVRADIRRGILPADADPSGHIQGALELARLGRERVGGIELALDQADAWSGAVPIETEAMLRMMFTGGDFKTPRARASLSKLLSSMAAHLRTSGADDLLGARPDVKPKDAALETLDAFADAARREQRDGQSFEQAAAAIRARAIDADARTRTERPKSPDGDGGPARSEGVEPRPDAPDPEPGLFAGDEDLAYLQADLDELDTRLAADEADGLIDADTARGARDGDSVTDSKIMSDAMDRAAMCLRGKKG